MEKITRRTLACLFISLLLTLGVGLFVFRFLSSRMNALWSILKQTNT